MPRRANWAANLGRNCFLSALARAFRVRAFCYLVTGGSHIQLASIYWTPPVRAKNAAISPTWMSQPMRQTPTARKVLS